MRSGESIARELFAQEYAGALREYVDGGGEAALTRAYELGRRAAGSGLGILELALLHHEALLGLPPTAAGDRPPVAMAAEFLAECMSPFEMTLRSYQANARLLGLGETLAQQNAEIDRSREQLRTILDATKAVIYLKDAEGRYLFVNRRFQEVFGVERDRAIGRRDDELLPAQLASLLRTSDRRVLESRAPQELEETLPGADGAHTYLALKFPLLDDRGAAFGLSCVATDITERKRADEAMQRARDAAERERRLREAVEARDQFLGIASHELKTPLTSLELQVASLRRLARSRPETAVSDERVQTKCDLIVRQVERLTGLINDLIEVGRLSVGSLGVAREPVELGALVRDVLARSSDAIERAGSEVALTVASPASGSWDRGRIETVVGNLLSNALKFGDGKPVDVRVDRVDDRAILSVRDRGLGIPLADQPRIFERFERAVSERHFGGFGIGLWVARQAVEAHGGTIRVRSEPGLGSEFTVELPLAGDAAAAAEAPA
jgi:PAS domain S-box-containing protein